MATGLQYKENLTQISGGYEGEITGSNGTVQDWTDTTGDSGTSTVTYWYRDSYTGDNNNSSQVNITVTDTWSASKDSHNNYNITVHSVITSITRQRIGSPQPYSVSVFVRRTAGGANIWTSGGCIDATINTTIATDIDLGTYTMTLPPGHATDTYGTVYYRSNTCGHDGDTPPSGYIDEFWIGLNFRNTLPPDYRPGKTYTSSSNDWLSHNRSAGWAGIWNGSSFAEMRTESGNGSTTGNPPYIRNASSVWANQREIGTE